MAFFEDLSRKVQDVAFAAAEKGKEVAAIASEKAQDAADTVFADHAGSVHGQNNFEMLQGAVVVELVVRAL